MPSLQQQGEISGKNFRYSTQNFRETISLIACVVQGVGAGAVKLASCPTSQWPVRHNFSCEVNCKLLRTVLITKLALNNVSFFHYHYITIKYNMLSRSLGLMVERSL